jgi:Mlc titration factor MtfA (ptsG expression regulator)
MEPASTHSLSALVAMALTLVFALTLLTWLLAEPWLIRRRRARLRSQPFPAHWRRILRRRVPLFQRLPTDLQLRLKQDMQVFLAEKPIIGCKGLVVTDDMRVTVAANACLLLMGARRAYFPRLRQVLLYPGAFVVDRPHPAPEDAWLQSDDPRELSGESWTDGQVLLSWADVAADSHAPDDGRNLVLHEFAHQLDQIKGFANGAPLLPSRDAYQRWSSVMQREYDALHRRLAEGEAGLIDPYGATDAAEFFAVVTELFFECPQDLAQQHPQLFAELSRFYRLNPLNWA